jgi:hypothetical protein
MGARGPGGEGREGGASGWQSCGAGTAGAKKAQSRGESGGPRGIHHLRRRQRGSPRPDPQPPLRCHSVWASQNLSSRREVKGQGPIRSQGSIMERGNGEGVSIAYVIQRAREVTSGTSGTQWGACATAEGELVGGKRPGQRGGTEFHGSEGNEDPGRGRGRNERTGGAAARTPDTVTGTGSGQLADLIRTEGESAQTNG